MLIPPIDARGGALDSVRTWKGLATGFFRNGRVRGLRAASSGPLTMPPAPLALLEAPCPTSLLAPLESIKRVTGQRSSAIVLDYVAAATLDDDPPPLEIAADHSEAQSRSVIASPRRELTRRVRIDMSDALAPLWPRRRR